MLQGLLHLPWWGYIVVTLILTHITVMATTVFLHRSQAHRALTIHPLLSHPLRFWLWLTTGVNTKHWVAVHRRHHAKCETPEDPHSPQVLGLRKVLFQGYELYIAATLNSEIIERYGTGTPDDWLERHLYSRHRMLGVLSLLGIYFVLFGFLGISMWAIQMIWIPFFAGGVINGIGHYWGYRNFECTDAARNITPLGLIAGGEELHNNHHTFPTSAKLSVKWWEFDIGWLYIRVFQWLHLVKVKRLPPKLVQDPNKKQIDLETVTTLIGNRFQVMTRYGRQVILPILQEERQKASLQTRVLLRKAKTFLLRTDSLLDEKSRLHLQQILEKSQRLQRVYYFRQKLQAIWSRTTLSQRELIEALQEWCKQAEATGISSLRNFAVNLRGLRGLT